MNKQVAWILAALFGLAFLGASLMNAQLIGRSRRALASGRFHERPTTESARYQVIVILPDTDDSFIAGLHEGIREGATEVGAAIQVFRYPNTFPLEAERYFEIALRTKVDGLIMYTPRNDKVIDRANRAAQSGVIFVPVGTDAPFGSPPGFIGSGTFLQGLDGGKQICSKLGASARIGVILPATGTGKFTEEPIYRGLAEAVQAFRGAGVVAVARARPGILSGEETTAVMLREHPDVNALFCSSSRDTMGAAQVVIDTNRVGKVLLIGADETPEIRRYIDKGIIAASIVRDSRRIGQGAVINFACYKENRPVPRPVEAEFVVRTSKGVSR
jgi:ribose transport system substrate-binding protein